MNFLSKLHTALRSARATRRGATMRPDLVPRDVHKSYPRMPRITLPTPQPLSIPLDTAITTRRSFNAAKSLGPMNQNELGTLLGVALGKADRPPFRHYPSGGTLFPVESYLIGSVVEGMAPGVFHYNPSLHALEHLWNVANGFSTEDITTTQSAPLGSMVLVFTAVWERSSAKYGDLAYLHASIESGHMAQNLLLVSTALGIDARPIAGFDDDLVRKLLDLDESEQPLYAILLAPPATNN